MGEMREWWANVYFMQGGAVVSASRHGTRDQARRNSFEARVACVHVRLKPEGAPRRYADALDRWIWENGATVIGGMSDPRTPKIEESAS